MTEAQQVGDRDLRHVLVLVKYLAAEERRRQALKLLQLASVGVTVCRF